jgi:endonuclease YncB( thermonuclease family)
MSPAARVSRLAGRAVAGALIARTTATVVRRYPIVAVALFVARWWRRRNARLARSDRTVVRLRRGETVTVSDKRA